MASNDEPSNPIRLIRACVRLGSAAVAGILVVGCAAHPIRHRSAIAAPPPPVVRAHPAAGPIVFASRGSDGRYHVWSQQADGSGGSQLTFGEADDRAPAWSPDGTLIAFARATGPAAAPTTARIFVMGADGRGVSRVTSGRTFDQDPSWAPDGKRVLFSAIDAVTQMARISVARVDGRGRRPLTSPSPGCADREPAWSPDGSLIAFVRKCGTESSNLFLMAADGTGLQLLTTFGRTPDWSPDGARIAYTGLGSFGPAVFVIGADGMGKQELVADFSGDPNWSPDGSQIVFTESQLTGPNLFVMDLDGTGIHRVTSLPNAVGASW